MKSPIIENPKGATRLQHIGQGFLTGVFWVVFGVLLRPLITLAAWLLGGHFLSQTLSGRDGFWGLLLVPVVYLVVIVAMAAVLIGWASYNLVRFRRNERRTRQPAAVTAAELASFFGVQEQQVARWQDARRIVMGHDENGVPREEALLR